MHWRARLPVRSVGRRRHHVEEVPLVEEERGTTIPTADVEALGVYVVHNVRK